MWNVVLDVLAADGVRDNLFRLRGVIPIGEGTDGEFILGAPTRLAARLLDGTYRRPVEQALASLLPSPVRIDIVTPTSGESMTDLSSAPPPLPAHAMPYNDSELQSDW
ncbi:MAG: hypothetical protein R3A46_10195 [Thermomicrobiales bacterium]